MCDAVNLLENQIPEGGHARDLAPRLKRLREQAQLKLDAYQQSIISSNYPSVNANYDGENRSPHHQHGSQSANIGDSPPEDKATAAGEDDKLAVLGTATRVLEGKLRQSSRHHNNSHKQLMGSSKSTGGSSYNSATPPGVNGVGSASSTSYSSFTNSYSPSFGSLQQGQLQQQQQQQASMPTGSSSGLPVYNASTPTAQSQPFAMGKGAMPVNIGYVDQSLAELLAEVSTPGRDPALTSAAGMEGADDDEDDSGMMYFNMPSGSTPGATSPLSSGANIEGEGNAFSSFSFTTQDSFKAPRNPSSSATSPTAGTSGKSTNTTSSSTSIPSGSVSQSSTASSSNYTALPDAGVSPSSGLNFGQSDMGLSENGVVSPTGNGSSVASGSSFLSSIPGLLAPSPGASPYGSYTTSSSASEGRRGSMQDSMSDGISKQQQQQTSQQPQATMRTSQNGQSQRQYGNAVNNGGNPEDSYLDTAWMDYFPTPGVGLFPQSTGLLFGGSSGTSTPGGGPVLATSQMVAPPQQQQPQMMSSSQGQGGQRGSISFSDGAGNIYPITHPGQPRQQQQQGMQQYHSPPHQLPHPHQQQQQMHQQQQQQQRGRYMPQQAGPPGAGNMNTYRAYDDMFGSGNNRY